MSKLDRLKEDLAIQKLLFSISVALVVGLTGWVVANFDRHWLLLLSSTIAVVAGAFFGYSRFSRMNQLLREIEDA